MSTHAELLSQVERLAAEASDTKTLMQRLADHVHSVIPRYNSVSFRLIDPANSNNTVSAVLTEEEKQRIATQAQISLAADTWPEIL